MSEERTKVAKKIVHTDTKRSSSAIIAQAFTVARSHTNPSKSVWVYIFDVMRATIPTILYKFKGFILIPILVRTLGLGDYGNWVQITAIMGVIALFGGLGLHTSLIRYYPECKANQDQKDLIFSILLISVVCSLLIVAILWSFIPLIAELILVDAKLIDIIRVSTFLVPLNSIHLILLTVFRAQNRIQMYVSFKSIASIVDLLIVIGTIYFFNSLRSLIVGNLLSLLVINSILICVHLKSWSLFPVFTPSMANVRKYIKYSFPVLPTQFSDEITARGDRILVGFFLGASSVGVYSVIYALASIPAFLNTPVVEVLFPKLSHFRAAGKHSNIAHYTRTTVFGLALLSMGLLVIILIVRDWLWFILAGPNTEIVTSDLLALLLFTAGLGTIIFALSRVLVLNLYVGDKTHIIPPIYITAALVNVFANLLLIPWIGLLGATIATLIAYTCMLLVTLWYIRRIAMI